MPGYGNPAGLYRMLVLAVTPSRCDQKPAILLYLLDYISDFWGHELVFNAAS
jgi:hypothetical protein